MYDDGTRCSGSKKNKEEQRDESNGEVVIKAIATVRLLWGKRQVRLGTRRTSLKNKRMLLASISTLKRRRMIQRRKKKSGGRRTAEVHRCLR
uniref:Uncharacterized protein n=1 Tax=Hyaloperonospora arabidopsidis (strain Emoy2) TaxID=559515 RepID=M4C2S5_HYAAE